MDFTVMTFNVRYDDGVGGIHSWHNRRKLALEIVGSHQPSLVGLQEPTGTQWEDIRTALPEYSWFGTPDEDGEGATRHGGFFQTSRFAARDSGVFWLSS